MDNFTGIFGDGELENLDLPESYPGAPPAASTAEMEQNQFQQAPGNTQAPSQTQQKINPTQPQQAVLPGQPPQAPIPGQPQQAGMPPYPNQPGYQYPPGQFQGQPYRPPYPGQEMYNPRPAMSPNQSMQGWNGPQEPIGQVPANYQPPYSMPNTAPTNPTYPSQGHMPQGYQGMPPQSMNQPYTGGPSQGMPYQGGQRPPYPGYDPQRPASPGISGYPGQPGAPGNANYPMMQNPRQPYHLGNFPRHPSSDMSQYPPMSNGTSGYRAPYPGQPPVARQQLSPMPRSMSPHPRANTNLSMASPVSSPASQAQNPSPNPGVPPTSLQQLEGMVNTNSSNGRNTPTNPASSVPQPMQSPGIYSNNSVHSPLGPRAPMSPGIGNRPPNPGTVGNPCPPSSPQQWQPQRPVMHQNYMPGQPPGALGSQRLPSQAPSPGGVLGGQGTNPVVSDSISSASGSPKPSDSCIGMNKEFIASGGSASPAVENKESDNADSVPTNESTINGAVPVIEPQAQISGDPNVPPTSATNINPSAAEASPSVSSHPPSLEAESASSNENPQSTPTFSMPPMGSAPNPTMPSINQYGNTMPRYSAPQGHLGYPPQGYRYPTPRPFGPQGMQGLRPGPINPMGGHPPQSMSMPGAMGGSPFPSESNASPGTNLNPDQSGSMSSDSTSDVPKDTAPVNGSGIQPPHSMPHQMSGTPPINPTSEPMRHDSPGVPTNMPPGSLSVGGNPMMSQHGPPMGGRPTGPMSMNGPRGPMHMMGPGHSVPPGQHMGMRPQSQMMMRPMGMSMMSHGPRGPHVGHSIAPGQNPLQHPQALNMEIQNVQQQLQQMYKMPQSVQTQQAISEMQQKLSHLQQQQQYYQPMYQPPPPPAVPDTNTKSPKKKTPAKPRTPKEPKTPKPKKEAKPKEPKPKKETKPKEPPKEPKTPKPKKSGAENKRSRGKKDANKIEIVGPDGLPIPMETTESTLSNPPSILDQALAAVDDPIDTSQMDNVMGVPTAIPSLPPLKPKASAEKKPKVKSATPARKKPSAKLNLNFKKKKRRRGSESDFSDGEGPPLPINSELKEEDEANKRRSGRIQGSRKKYVDELDLDLSEEDDSGAQKDPTQNGEPVFEGSKPNLVYVDPNSEDQMAVQFILQTRMGEREILSDSEDESSEKKEPEAEKKPARKIEVEEYYVKYKAFSYLHCEWRTEEELLKGDKRIQGKIKRFKAKKQASQNLMDFLEEEAFNPDYTEVDRILDATESADPTTGKVTQQYLVKWKSLPYEDATWETGDDVPADRVEAYNAYKDPPARIDHKPKRRPKPEEWKKEQVSPIYKNNNQLREYQLEGLNWLTFSYYNNHNCILADEMGLGKTIQSLSFINAIYQYGIRGPFLIIAPLSTIPNWQREFEGWTDLNIVVYHGSQLSRNMILEYEMYYKDEKGERIPNVYRFNVLITTFEVIISDCIDLKEIQWRCCVIDEAHRLKNRNCKLLEGLRLMHLDHRVLLSGTPLQNNVNELFSLLNFLEPLQFASQEDFLKEFGTLESEDQVKKLQALLKPMMLRRMKEDVEKSLAPKEETIIEVELTNIQKKYYRAILEKNFEFLVKGATCANVPSLMNTMMELRKCCLHPYLLNGAEDAIQRSYKENHSGEDAIHNALVQSSGKLVLVDKLLPKLKKHGHRVLIFSQMVRLLDIIEDYLIGRKYPYERLDGRIRGNLRQAAIDRYCKPDSDRFVFLLCTKAGGLGINLTAADTVIIYDSDWNPQNDLQAQARCHRIGQQKSVKIYRLLCRNTYEREMFDKASMKLGLDKAVLQSMNTDGKGNGSGGNAMGLSKKDIENLLKKGAYGALMDDDNQADKFCEEDIDSIMSRRATVVQLESEKGSTFSKASFSAANTRSDIDVDDPEFWKKWAKTADIDTDAGEKKKQLIVEEPRRRAQIRRYGHDEGVVDCSDLESSASDSDRGEDLADDIGADLRMRTRRGRGRGRSMRSCRLGGRATRASRWATEEEVLEGDNVKYGYWGRSECFKVEKGLLTFGWGRWKEIKENNEFRSTWRDCDINDCARMILLFCIRYYKGDDKIKGFIFDLISPVNDGKARVYHNHIGLSAPVPRGRKGKKKLREAKLIASHMDGADWAKEEKYDTEMYLDQGYSRHLTRHANKVLLRVRLLFYIRQEIIGDLSTQIEEGVSASELPIHPPQTDMAPKTWWDIEADKSILVGVYKHGYDRYNVMRNDPTLCFLGRCGPPDKAALMAEMVISVNEDEMDIDDKDEDKDDDKVDEDSNATPASPAVSSVTNKSDDESKPKDKDSEDKKNYLPFPTSSDMNGRLRRLVTSYQRNNKKMEMRKEASMRGYDHYIADKMLRREKMAEYMRDRELRKADYNQRRWSNREQAEFYRTVSTFGVEYDREEKRYNWAKFRNLSRLEKRQDENLTEYFKAFLAMCKRQCGIRVSEAENAKIVESGVDRLPEERARRVIERVELLNRIRSEVLPHSNLSKALNLALPCKDLPEWWIPGKHDYDLVKGVARHGLGRTDYYILYDPDLGFREIVRRHTAGEPLITEEEKEYVRKKFYNKEPKSEAKSKQKITVKSEKDLVKSEKTDEESGDEKSKIKTEKEPEQVKEEPMEIDEKPDVKKEDSSEKEDKQESQTTDEEKPSEENPDKETEQPTSSQTPEASKEEKVDTTSEEAMETSDSKTSDKEVTGIEESKEKPQGVKADDQEDTEQKDDQKETVSESKKSEDESTSSNKKSQDETTPEEKKSEDDAKKTDEESAEKKTEEDSSATEKETSSSEKVQPETEEPSKKSSKSEQGPLGSLQQMDDEMAKMEPVVVDGQTEPTVAQLLAQSTANSFHWAKERVLQTRLEHIIKAVENLEWPVSIDFVGADHDTSGPLKCETPPSAPSTPVPHDLYADERKRRRQMEKEVERAQMQAMIHPNLHQGLKMSELQSSAVAMAALGFGTTNLSPAHLRSLFEFQDKKTSAESQVNALKQLQALQGSLDLTVKPVASQNLDLAALMPRRGPGRPRIDEHSRNSDKKRKCDSPQDSKQDKRRKKLDEIVMGLSSKGKDDNPLALLKGSSVTLHPTKERSSEGSTKVSSSLSITPANHKGDKQDASSSKSGLLKGSELPPGINLPPGIELYRPPDSAKVDKWLEQHRTLMGSSKDTSKRKSETPFDWGQLSPDERIDVISTKTGQKLTGEDAPKLRNLPKWIAEHPSYEIDPQWVLEKSKGGNEAHQSSKRPCPEKQPSKPSSSSAAQAGALPKNFLDPKMSLAALANMDPKLLQYLDPKALAAMGLGKAAPAIDPNLLMTAGALDPKILASLGCDPKLLEAFVKQDIKPVKKPSPAPSPHSKAPSPKPSTSHGIDPKLLAGLDPQMLQGLDSKTLAALGMDPKLLAGGFDPKLLAMMAGGDKHAMAGMDPKMMGLDQQMMLLASLGVPAMAGLGMANPLLGGLQGFGIPGLQAMPSSSKSAKETQRNAAAAVAASQANLFFGGGGAAGLMYPPLGLGLGNFGLSQMSGALLNGLGSPITVTAGPSKQTSVSSSKKSDERRDAAKVDPKGGLSKEERNTLRQMKAERLARTGDSKLLESIPGLHQLDVTLERVHKAPEEEATKKSKESTEEANTEEESEAEPKN